MYIVGCDFHTRFQQIASLNTDTGTMQQLRLDHAGEAVRDYYAGLPKPVRVGIESTGYSLWFDELLKELGVELWVGDAATIAARRDNPKKKTDKVDAAHILKRLVREEFPRIHCPSAEVQDQLRLLKHRHRLVQLRTRVKNSLHAMALNYRKLLGPKLFTRGGRQQLAALPLPPQWARQRQDYTTLLQQLNQWIDQLDQEVERLVQTYPAAQRLQTHPGVGPVTALAATLLLEPIGRFRAGKAVASYLGLVPTEHSSAGHQHFGRLTQRGNRLLRFAILQSTRWAVRLDPELKRVYSRLVHSKGVPKARAAAGRRLSIRFYIMLRDEITYDEFCRRSPRSS